MSLAKLFIGFCEDTINGHESALYKKAGTKYLPIPKEDLKGDIMPPLIMQITCNYFNEAYKSLILKNDAHIQQKIDEMQAIHNHSVVCLLIMLHQTVLDIHNKLDRSKLSLRTYDDYMTEIKKQLKSLLTIKEDELLVILSHECKGIDIEKCDPNKPLFVLNFIKNNA